MAKVKYKVWADMREQRVKMQFYKFPDEWRQRVDATVGKFRIHSHARPSLVDGADRGLDRECTIYIPGSQPQHDKAPRTSTRFTSKEATKKAAFELSKALKQAFEEKIAQEREENPFE